MDQEKKMSSPLSTMDWCPRILFLAFSSENFVVVQNRTFFHIVAFLHIWNVFDCNDDSSPMPIELISNLLICQQVKNLSVIMLN